MGGSDNVGVARGAKSAPKRPGGGRVRPRRQPGPWHAGIRTDSRWGSADEL